MDSLFVDHPAARRLAVATLTEAGDAAAFFRGPGGRPLQGYVLITGEGDDCRITVYLEQGLGAHTAVLAGEVVWLQTQALAPAVQAAGATGAGATGTGATGIGARATGTGAGATGAGATGIGAPEPWSGLLADAGSPAVGSPEEADTEEPAEVGFKLYPEPATPVSAIHPHKIEVLVTPVEQPAAAPVAAAGEPLAVAMTSRHPMAPRAGGTARVDFAGGRLSLAVRGLPSPALLGRTYNSYRAWLLNQRAGTRHALGLLTRAWGENYRLESESDLPLSRFDAVLITAEDRSAGAPGAAAPQVLLGAYESPEQ